MLYITIRAADTIWAKYYKSKALLLYSERSIIIISYHIVFRDLFLGNKDGELLHYCNARLHHVSEAPVVPIARWLRQVHRIPIAAVLLISPPILPPQQPHLTATQDNDDQARPARNPHALAVVRLVRHGEDIGTQDGSTLTTRGQDGQRTRPLGVCRVRVPDPGEDEGHGDEDLHGQEEPEVPGRDGRLGPQDYVADGSDEGGADDERPAHVDPVGDEC